MAFVIKFVKGVRTHWKKSTFLAVAVAYGANYAKEQYEAKKLMREYCLEAKKYGDQPIEDGVQPKNVIVILNPNANKRKATKQFDKYCAPILHLAGIAIDIQQTESEGHARTLVENMQQTDAIIIGGGDGTISEVITGLFRRTNNDKIKNPCPIGILPLGQTNTLGRVLFPGGDSLAIVRSLADASLAIVQESVRNVDVMKIEVIENKLTENVLEEQENVSQKVENIENEEKLQKNQETVQEKPTEQIEKSTEEKKVTEEQIDKTPPKPVYALATFEWGAYRDAYAKQEKYWYWGSLRKYATYIFSGYKKDLTWECNAEINYLEPCEGCSNCYKKPDSNRRWWSRFFSRPKPVEIDYSKIINERCSMQHTKEINTTDFQLTTTNTEKSDIPQLHLKIGPSKTGYFGFVSEGFKTVKGENRAFSDVIEARQIEINPKNVRKDKEVWFSIDKEEYEVRPVRITILPKALKIFCKPENNV